MPTAEVFPQDFSFLDKIPDQDLEDIVASLRAGVTAPGDALGFDEAALNHIEQTAVAYYQVQRFAPASTLFGFMAQMNPKRASAWRGLGACAQATRKYALACICYDRALQLDPLDIVSHVYLGESLCHSGKKEEGLLVLQGALEKGLARPEAKPYLLRARAIVVAGGVVPARIFMSQAANESHKKALAALKAVPEYAYDPERPLSIDDMKRNPEIAPLLKDLGALVKQGRLTLADVGGFTAKELDGTYATAVKLVETNQSALGVQLVGLLMLIDPAKSKYYQLAAIGFQRLKQYALADHYYALAFALEEPKDARTLTYRGENKIMMGEIDEGIKLVRDGVKAAGKKREYEDVAKRGTALIKQFKK